MRTWVKVGLVGVSLVARPLRRSRHERLLCLSAAQDEHRNEDAVTKDFDAIRSRFGARPALIEVTDVRGRDFKINRPAQRTAAPSVRCMS